MYEKVEECPICSGIHFKNHSICKDQLVSKESFAIVKCTECGLLFTNPRPSKDSIGRYYESEQYLSHHKTTSLIGRLYRLAQRYTLWSKYRLIKNYTQSGSMVLDYGCGSGSFLAYLKEKNITAVGVEPNEVARENALNTGSIVYANVEQLKLAEKKYSVITLWHVLEHLHELKATVKTLRKLIEKNGYLIVAVPNIGSWDANHYGEHWAAYDVPRHLYHFSSTSLTTLMKNSKLSFIKKQPMYLDSFYVSLLSEIHIKGKANMVRSLIQGCKSNIYGNRTGEYSSMIYIFQKK